MAINTAIGNEENEKAAALRQEQNKARALNRVGNYEKVAGKAMRATGKAVDTVGRGIRKGGTGMMKAGARMSSSGVGIIAGAPLMAVGGLTAAAGLGTQGVGKVTKSTGRGVEKAGRTAKLRAAQQGARAQLKKMLGTKDEEAGGMISWGAQKTTSGLLKASWLNLIPSFGFTLLWINFHVFLRWIFPSFFCKLGKEWIPRSLAKFSGRSTAMLQIGETMLLVILDVSFGLLILCCILLVTRTVQTVSGLGTEAASSFLGGVNPVLGAAAKLINLVK